MYRRPGIVIVLSVFLSMAIAIVYHRTAQSPSFASQAGNVVREIANATEEGTGEIKSCHCIPRGRRITPYLVQKKQDCSADSLVYQKVFEAMPALFRERRASTPAEFPRVCMIRILNMHKPLEMQTGKCGAQVPLCVTEEYVNIVYNSYADVFSCFDLPQKEILPWFLLNGGFHLNAKHGSAGLLIAQSEAKQLLQNALARLSSRAEGSCQRLLSQAQKFEIREAHECLQSSPPENPVLSFLLFAERYLQNYAKFKVQVAELNSKKMNIEVEHLLQLMTLQSFTSDSQEVISGYQQFIRSPASDNYVEYTKKQKPELMEKMSKAIEEFQGEFKDGTCISDALFSSSKN